MQNLLLGILLSFSMQASAQQSVISLNLEADFLSVSASANFNLHPMLNPGAGYKFGHSINGSFTNLGLLWYREHSIWFVYNRFEVRENLDLDIGVRGGEITLVDNNPFEGFRHLNFIGGYIQPMVGWPNLKLGPMIALGHAWGFTSVIDPLIVRYTFRF